MIETQLELRDPGHAYYHNGTRLVGVTEAMRAAGILTTFNLDEKARDRGHRVHKACALYDTGKLLEPGDVEPYVDAWRLYLAETEAQVLGEFAVELALADPVRGYAGTLDVAVRKRSGHIAIVDRKSVIDARHAARVVGIQLSAYKKLWNLRVATRENGLWAALREAVVLDASGRYKRTEFTQPADDAYWDSVLNVVHLQKEVGTYVVAA